MAVVRSVTAYLRSAVLGDTSRRFQVRREADGATLARAEIEHACIELSSRGPARWPPECRQRYVALEEVMRAAETLAAL